LKDDRPLANLAVVGVELAVSVDVVRIVANRGAEIAERPLVIPQPLSDLGSVEAPATARGLLVERSVRHSEEIPEVVLLTRCRSGGFEVGEKS
jgi:hypothetical protein